MSHLWTCGICGLANISGGHVCPGPAILRGRSIDNRVGRELAPVEEAEGPHQELRVEAWARTSIDLESGLVVYSSGQPASQPEGEGEPLSVLDARQALMRDLVIRRDRNKAIDDFEAAIRADVEARLRDARREGMERAIVRAAPHLVDAGREITRLTAQRDALATVLQHVESDLHLLAGKVSGDTLQEIRAVLAALDAEGNQ